MAADKFRIVLDYLPCEACLEIPVGDQDLHCSLCRRLTRAVAVASHTEVAVLVESPALPLPVEVPPAPAEAVPVEPAPVVEAAAEVQENAEPVPPPEPEDEVDVAFEATPPAAEEEIEVAFEATRPEPEPVEEAEPEAAEATAEAPLYTFDPESLRPGEGFAPAAEEDAAALDDAEAWADAAPEPEEVELEPVRPDEAAYARRRAPPEPVEEAPPETWVEEVPEEPAELEVLEVVDEEPATPPPPAEAAPEAAEYEVLEVVEEDPVEAPAEETWQDDAWPEESPAPALAASTGEEEPAAVEVLGEEPATPPPPAPVEDPVTLLDGLGPMYAERLLAQGVQTLHDLAAQDPGKLAKASGVAPKLVKRWVGVASLHVAGVPLAYADALVEAGYESPRDLRRGKPEKVAKGVNKVLSARGEGTEPVDAARVEAWQRG